GRTDEPRRRGAHRNRQGAGARSRARRLGARERCLLPVRRRPTARARRGRLGDRAAGRLTPRRGGDRGDPVDRRRSARPDPAAPLAALTEPVPGTTVAGTGVRVASNWSPMATAAAHRIGRDEVVWAFGPDLEAVLEIDPGEIVTLETNDCFTGQ